ncbi:MAG: adenine deaminase [Bacteroidales bacterium]|nr:adenine deaminase [Bacteroidales bacterium]
MIEIEFVRGNLVDIHSREVYPAEIRVAGGSIESVRKLNKPQDQFILPGFIDAHVHIESSMVSPTAFSKVAVRHGTIGLVSDPHEIANVMGLEGVYFMIENSKKTPLKILFGAPSCVPATNFESSGASIGPEDIRKLLELPEVGYLSEMMNYPGVIFDDPGVLKKLEIARAFGVPIDGHAPGLSGKHLEKYVSEGISTDHECFSYQEALEKIRTGMKILIREGSGAKNFKALIPLLKNYPDEIMFCSDDLHPDDLQKGHINVLVKRAIEEGFDLFDTVRAAGWNAAEHYGLHAGMLRVGDPADFILVDSLADWNVVGTYIEGRAVYSGGVVNIEDSEPLMPNCFKAEKIDSADLLVRECGKKIRIIKAIDGELITKELIRDAKLQDGNVVPDIENDILKISVVNRYDQQKPAVAFIHGFGLKKGAMASSIGHDSHNIICVGTADEPMKESINWIINNRGGIVVYDETQIFGLPLEIGGIMSAGSVDQAAGKYQELSRMVKVLGSDLKAPFMTLAFMALLVIPELKLSDKGLFNGNNFSFTPLFVEGG